MRRRPRQTGRDSQRKSPWSCCCCCCFCYCWWKRSRTEHGACEARETLRLLACESRVALHELLRDGSERVSHVEEEFKFLVRQVELE